MASPKTRFAAIGLSALTVLALTACGSSGREMREHPTGQTAPPRNAPAAGTLDTGPTSTTQSIFSLATDQWDPGGPMPAMFTCDGDDTSPPLSISSPPEGTAELALVMTDLDAEGLVHWVVAGIPADTSRIPASSLPTGAVQALVADDRVGWFGPCPPEGETHTYEFEVYALSEPSGVVDGELASAAMSKIDAVATNRSTLTATYRRLAEPNAGMLGT